MRLSSNSSDPQVVAFYYPQFHQSPLNDRLYGEGFTEWVNVERGVPLFDGHQQPRVPGDKLGRYSLDDPRVFPRQVEMAKEAGIAGFCFYHYWMTGGRRILERPFDAMLRSDSDFPFCLMWANHDWTMAWRGEPNTLSLEMTYATQDPEDFIVDILDALQDPRYIRIDDKPVLTIYEIDGPPNLSQLITGLRDAARKHGVGEIFVAGVQIRLHSPNRLCPDLDALCEFPPHGYYTDENRMEEPEGVVPNNAQFFDYRKIAADSVLGINMAENIPYFRSAVPDWDNTARRLENVDPFVFMGSTPERYGQWVKGLLGAVAEDDFSLPVVFVNAWNEWGEAAYLEPDAHSGSGYLEATRDAVDTWRDSSPAELAESLLSHRPEVLTEREEQEQEQELEPEATAAAFLACKDAPNKSDDAVLWIDRLQFETAPFDGPTRLYAQPGEISGFIVHIDERPKPGKIKTHDIYLCGEDGNNYKVSLPARKREDLLKPHGDWLDAGNVVSAGFDGVVDFGSVPLGNYELRVPCGKKLYGTLKSQITIEPKSEIESAPMFNITRLPKADRSIFEPGTEYSASFRPGSAHDMIAQFVADRGAQRILDCGCADGSFGAHLAQRGLEVHGLEYDRVALAHAQTRLASAAPADFELANWASRASGPFDALMFIDVLEHVRRPDLVIGQARELLAPDGALLTSIPNVAHLSQRLDLLVGKFEYQDWGLLDRTHLRFFTKDSIEQMFTEAGYRIERIEYTKAPPGILSELPDGYEGLQSILSEESDAYQYIVSAVLAD